MKLFRPFKIFFRNIWKIIDRKIVVPITKVVLWISDSFKASSKKIERWLSKTNTLLFLSLFMAIIVFVVIDQKILLFSENSAEVLKEQPVHATYNEEAYVVEGLPKKVDVTLIGRKADLYFAKQSPSQDITVDLSDLKPGMHKVNIKYNQILPSIEYKVNPSVATVMIYPKVSETRTLDTDILNQDSLDSKLVLKSVNLNTDKVVIKGAEHRLKEVSTVKALVDIENLISQEEGTVKLNDIPLKAYDKNGDSVNVEIVPSKVSAEVTIDSPSKELPIRVIPNGDISFGYAISEITTNESRVTVYGSESALDKLRYVPVYIDVKDLNTDRQYKQEIKRPVGVRSMSVNNITINVKLGKSVDKEVNDVSIEYRNLSDEYTVQGLSAADTKVSVVLKGVNTVLDTIKTEDITAYLDLDGYTEGEHEVPVEVEGEDVRIQYIPKTKKVKIKIVKK
jgi:ybbR-like domain-containing protein ybbR